jgi:hypothetical protein
MTCSDKAATFLMQLGWFFVTDEFKDLTSLQGA